MSIKSRLKQNPEERAAYVDSTAAHFAVRAIEAERRQPRTPIDIEGLSHTLLVLANQQRKNKIKEHRGRKWQKLRWKFRPRRPLFGGIEPTTIEQHWGQGEKTYFRLTNGMVIRPIRGYAIGPDDGKVCPVIAPYTDDFRNYVAGKLAA